jgi:predicted ArsR family transcriptional regulator
MTETNPIDNEVYSFVVEQIDSVPHLEALLLLWNSRPQPWTIENLAQRLYISKDIVRGLLEDLIRQRMIVLVPGSSPGYRYSSESTEKDQLMANVDNTYKREVVRISTMIHSKPSASLRDFAKAFRFTKERD